ncbi:MAG: hypothetical protein AB7I19_07960 [Planctomycetota bacterium]
MPQPIAVVVAWIVELYLGVGLLFGIWFVAVGASRSDVRMRTAPIPVRILLLPGAILLWPTCLARVITRSSPA